MSRFCSPPCRIAKIWNMTKNFGMKIFAKSVEYWRFIGILAWLSLWFIDLIWNWHFLRIYNQFSTKFQNGMIPHGGAESALWLITSRPYQISNLLKCHVKVLIIWHKVTKKQRYNYYDQKPIFDFRRSERILVPHAK